MIRNQVWVKAIAFLFAVIFVGSQQSEPSLAISHPIHQVAYDPIMKQCENRYAGELKRAYLIEDGPLGAKLVRLWARCLGATFQEKCSDEIDYAAHLWATGAYGVGFGETVVIKQCAADVFELTWHCPLKVNKNLSPPTIIGRGELSYPLTVKKGSWTKTVSERRYFWYRDGHSVASDQDFYVVTPADVGHKITVQEYVDGYCLKTASAKSASVIGRTSKLKTYSKSVPLPVVVTQSDTCFSANLPNYEKLVPGFTHSEISWYLGGALLDDGQSICLDAFFADYSNGVFGSIQTVKNFELRVKMHVAGYKDFSVRKFHSMPMRTLRFDFYTPRTGASGQPTCAQMYETIEASIVDPGNATQLSSPTKFIDSQDMSSSYCRFDFLLKYPVITGLSSLNVAFKFVGLPGNPMCSQHNLSNKYMFTALNGFTFCGTENLSGKTIANRVSSIALPSDDFYFHTEIDISR